MTQGEEFKCTTTFAHLELSTTVTEGMLDTDHDLLTTSTSHQLQAEAAISFLQLPAKPRVRSPLLKKTNFKTAAKERSTRHGTLLSRSPCGRSKHSSHTHKKHIHTYIYIHICMYIYLKLNWRQNIVLQRKQQILRYIGTRKGVISPFQSSSSDC